MFGRYLQTGVQILTVACNPVRANISAKEGDKLPDGEILGQLKYVCQIKTKRSTLTQKKHIYLGRSRYDFTRP